MRATWLVLVACVALGTLASAARAAFAVPPLEGHVTDAAHVLSPEERADLEQRLTRAMNDSGVEIAVLIAQSLEGETIEDVAYKTFNTWGIGRERLDNGVLLVIALNEHRIRIETGKGIGGRLTDLQASDVIEHRIAPLLRAGRLRDGVADGTDAIVAALASDRVRSAPSETVPTAYVALGIIALFLALAFLRVRFGGSPVWLWLLLWLGRGGGGGHGGRGGRGGYSGGGGRSGGGGASGSW